MGGKDMDDSQLSVPPEIFHMEMYQKWGLGNKRDFSRKEKYYLMQLPMLEQVWQTYTSIDIKKLTADEKNFLQDTRAKYGKGLINLRMETMKKQGKLQPHQENWFDLIKAVTGTDVLNDNDLVFVYRSTPR
jgi:hypothetical protein